MENNQIIKCNELLPNPTDPQEGLNELIKYILGEDWYVTESMTASQVNTIAIEEIKKKWDLVTLKKARNSWNNMIDKLKL